MEVILTNELYRSGDPSILHVCGGDPVFELNATIKAVVFSTYVEVILPSRISFRCLFCILHVCGGDPASLNRVFDSEPYSPRMWR